MTSQYLEEDDNHGADENTLHSLGSYGAEQMDLRLHTEAQESQLPDTATVSDEMSRIPAMRPTCPTLSVSDTRATVSNVQSAAAAATTQTTTTAVTVLRGHIPTNVSPLRAPPGVMREEIDLVENDTVDFESDHPPFVPPPVVAVNRLTQQSSAPNTLAHIAATTTLNSSDSSASHAGTLHASEGRLSNMPHKRKGSTEPDASVAVQPVKKQQVGRSPLKPHVNIPRTASFSTEALERRNHVFAVEAVKTRWPTVQVILMAIQALSMTTLTCSGAASSSAAMASSSTAASSSADAAAAVVSSLPGASSSSNPQLHAFCRMCATMGVASALTPSALLLATRLERQKFEETIAIDMSAAYLQFERELLNVVDSDADWWKLSL